MSGRATTRRGALRIVAAGLALPLGAMGLRALGDAPQAVRWHGEVLGALSTLTLWHPNPGVARRAIGRVLVEVARLESVFSLYRDQSEIARLNRDGRLDAPSGDLLRVLEESRRISELSGGAFDPTIQPLWQLHAAGAPDPAARDRALALVDHTAISARRHAIRLGLPGMALSLNGIAQGYVTDRVTEILRNDGFESAMVELGETRALGAAPDGQPFTVGLVDPAAPTMLDRELALSNAALSVSGGYGLSFGAGRHHILDPATGESAMRLSRVAVVAPTAMIADALSTAIYVAGPDAAGRLLSARRGARAFLTGPDNTTTAL